MTAPLRIMPLGDSLTVFDCRLNAFTTADDRSIFWSLDTTPPISIYPKGTYFVVSPGGYRGYLANLLEKEGIAWSYVGRQFLCGSHEGYAGETLQWLADNVVTNAVLSARPDIILLLGGTNDFFWPPPRGSREPRAVAQRLRSVLNLTLAASPATTVLVAEVPPIHEGRCKQYHTARWHPGDCPADMQANVRAYNARLPGIVEEYRGRGSDVQLVRQPTFDEADFWIWGIHFNTSGFEKMARAWHGALLRSPRVQERFKKREALRDAALEDPIHTRDRIRRAELVEQSSEYHGR